MGYSPDQKQAALELLAIPSNTYATVRNMTGIPTGTLSSWAKKAGLIRPNDKTDKATDARKQRIAARRAKLTEKLLRYAENMADHANDIAGGVIELPSRPGVFISGGKDAKDLMTAAAIALDKFRLEMGEATTRVETHDVGAAEKAKQKIDDLAERRAKRTA